MNNKKRTRKKLTLKDIAEVLSLTPATVSKALRDSSDISLETRERVKKKCEELGYRPNRLARSLISNRSRILGVLVPDLRISFFSEAVRGMYEESSIKGYECLLLVHDEDDAKERQKLEFLSDIGVDGILLNAVGSENNYSLYKNLEEEDIKFVCWDRKLDNLDFKSVIIDDINASYKLTKRIIDEGRKNILFLGPNTGIPVARHRFKGYKNALEENGIEFNPDLVLQTFRDVGDSYAKMQVLIKKGVKIDGIVSIGGLITYGAGKAVIDSGLSIPKDIILGEFGDNNIVARLGVPFYTVFQNPYKMGKASTDLLINLIESHTDTKKLDDIIIDSEVVQR
ncbi:MAG: LacI family DNA-binding transcriptional regulator [Ignavibacteria bacterium]|jgi:LacI family transcriptional regulator